jgi:hypothetical protein
LAKSEAQKFYQFPYQDPHTKHIAGHIFTHIGDFKQAIQCDIDALKIILNDPNQDYSDAFHSVGHLMYTLSQK